MLILPSPQCQKGLPQTGKSRKYRQAGGPNFWPFGTSRWARIEHMCLCPLISKLSLCRWYPVGWQVKSLHLEAPDYHTYTQQTSEAGLPSEVSWDCIGRFPVLNASSTPGKTVKSLGIPTPQNWFQLLCGLLGTGDNRCHTWTFCLVLYIS